MGFLDFIVNEVLSKPAIVIGLVALVGLLAQKKNVAQVVTGTVKTTLGFLILGSGAGILVNALLPLGDLLKCVIGVPGIIPTNEVVIGFAIKEYGALGAGVMALAFVVNILIARFTPLKFIHLSGHITFFTSYLVVAILATYLGLTGAPVVIVGAIVVGFYMAFTPWLIHGFTKGVVGDDPIALGHSSSASALFASLLGKWFGNKEKSIDELSVPPSLAFVRDMTIMMALSMFIIFLVIALLAGPANVKEITKSSSWFMWTLMSSLNFAAGTSVMLMGVRMTIAEIVPAFKGISTKIVPNAIPALDCPVMFPYSPNAVVPGFVMSVLGGFVAMAVLYAFGYPYVIIPGIIPHFFCGATAAVYGNAWGGRRGALLGAFFSGFALQGLGIGLLIPATGALAQTGSTFPDPDMGFFWAIFGYAIKVISGH
ncbi:MAG: PTS ascorbate transporter subunit IIC [Firmicutes bacterium]|nr:PTS ascorbate transporter subunit IIC [Bacillota bacterium]